jgi:pimeloyl-ACP methyl ester carboxylesterase
MHKTGRLKGLSPAGFHEIAYSEWGEPDNPRVVVCVHGLTRNGRDFDTLARALAESYRVLCPDVVGRGRSDWLKDPAHYGYPQYLADMNALIARSAVASVDWVGTSMGGLIGMLLAAHSATPVRRLVLNDVGPFLPRSALERIVGYAGDDPRFPDRSALDAYLREIYAPFGPFTEAQWGDLVDSTVRRTPAGDIALAYDPDIVVPMRAAPIEDVDLWKVWDAISCPSLLIRGQRSDVLLAQTADEMTRRGPKARLHEVEGIGHAPSLMSEDQIGLIVDWLGRGDC